MNDDGMEEEEEKKRDRETLRDFIILFQFDIYVLYICVLYLLFAKKSQLIKYEIATKTTITKKYIINYFVSE